MALDGKPPRDRAPAAARQAESLPVEAIEADLRTHEIGEDFDCVVSIGLLMFADCATAPRVLACCRRTCARAASPRNVLAEGTTYSTCSSPAITACSRVTRWRAASPAGTSFILTRDFDAPDQRMKSFVTLIARKLAPQASPVAAPPGPRRRETCTGLIDSFLVKRERGNWHKLSAVAVSPACFR